MDKTALEKLALLYGIEPFYWDIWGKQHFASEETVLAFLSSMGLTIQNWDDINTEIDRHQRKNWQNILPPVKVIRSADERSVFRLQFSINILSSDINIPLRWALQKEGGGVEEGYILPASLEITAEQELDGKKVSRCQICLDLICPFGYHLFRLFHADSKEEIPVAEMQLIAAPKRCFTPASWQDNERVFGLAIQLYAVRSCRNWGMGDLTDLLTLVDVAFQKGADLIGVNPLNALFMQNPLHKSPYSPSSRCFFNWIYIDVEAVADFNEHAEAQQLVKNAGFQEELEKLRQEGLVNYPGVAKLKKQTLLMLYDGFRKNHLQKNSKYAEEFQAFREKKGKSLEQFALFEALSSHFYNENPMCWGWPVWPEEYRRPYSKAVMDYAQANQDKIVFFIYLQWQFARQLETVTRRCRELGMAIGIYGDLPVGVDSAGFDVWQAQNLYADGVKIGAPPDDFNLKGQDWGLAPWSQRRLFENAYSQFTTVMQANMSCFKALRLDHVMSLMRLFWVPPQKTPMDGAYVRYNFDDLLGIVCLESQRNQCVVIGEDLGTVPDEVRSALQDAGVLSYRLFYFEKYWQGDLSFKQPEDYPEQALVAVTTHDLATIASFWHENDIKIRMELDLYPNEGLREKQIASREQDKNNLVRLIFREETPAELCLHELSARLHKYLARAPSRIFMIQLEDVWLQDKQVNLPGTVDEYPNWQIKLPKTIETMRDDPEVSTFFAKIASERKKEQ